MLQASRWNEKYFCYQLWENTYPALWPQFLLSGKMQLPISAKSQAITASGPALRIRISLSKLGQDENKFLQTQLFGCSTLTSVIYE